MVLGVAIILLELPIELLDGEVMIKDQNLTYVGAIFVGVAIVETVKKKKTASMKARSSSSRNHRRTRVFVSIILSFGTAVGGAEQQ